MKMLKSRVRGGNMWRKWILQKNWENKNLHWRGIEPRPPAWQARILPLNHQCLINYQIIIVELLLRGDSQIDFAPLNVNVTFGGEGVRPCDV